MKKIFNFFNALLFIVFTSEFSDAQLENLTFNVRTENFIYFDTVTYSDPCITGQFNKFTFDLYIQQTNIPSGDAEIMRFSLGQYYFNLNFGEGFGDTSGFNGYASVTYEPGSTTFSNPGALPLSSSFLAKNSASDVLSPEGFPVGMQRSTIRLNSNSVLGNMSDVQISAVYPGTKVGTFVVRKKVTAASPEEFFPNFSSYYIRWRKGPLNVNSINPFTKIFAYNGLGGSSTEVTYKGTYIMDTAKNCALPVELSRFTADVNRNIVNLNWSTVYESNNAGFDIERKAFYTEQWIKIGSVPGNGTVSEPKNYSFSDRINSGKYNYRLKQKDYNGNYEYFGLSNDVLIGIPDKFDLSQNYPNPFNPSTKINYDLPKEGHVSIKLFDVTGRQVATIVNEVKQAGYYTVQFTASEISSGMYFYRIEASDFVSTKKMVLIK